MPGRGKRNRANTQEGANNFSQSASTSQNPTNTPSMVSSGPSSDPSWQNKCDSNSSNWYLLENELFTDVEFAVGENNERMAAHKLILAKRSPVFQRMFYGDLAEGQKEIQLPDVEKDGFKNLLR